MFHRQGEFVQVIWMDDKLGVPSASIRAWKDRSCKTRKVVEQRVFDQLVIPSRSAEREEAAVCLSEG